jgi:hypothetical protein
MLLPDAESVPVSAGLNPIVTATTLFVMLVRLLFNQMEVRTRVAMMTVEEGRVSDALGSGVKENFAPPSGLDEDRLPTPNPTDPSHRTYRLSRAQPDTALGRFSNFDAVDWAILLQSVQACDLPGISILDLFSSEIPMLNEREAVCKHKAKR